MNAESIAELLACEYVVEESLSSSISFESQHSVAAEGFDDDADDDAISVSVSFESQAAGGLGCGDSPEDDHVAIVPAPVPPQAVVVAEPPSVHLLRHIKSLKQLLRRRDAQMKKMRQELVACRSVDDPLHFDSRRYQPLAKIAAFAVRKNAGICSLRVSAMWARGEVHHSTVRK